MANNKDVNKGLSNCFEPQINYELSSEESGKITILKLLLSVLVVYIHSGGTEFHFASGSISFDVPVWLENFKWIINQSIARCAVPGFFLLASILLYRKTFDYRVNIRRKFRTLLIPYILLNTFWIFFFSFVKMLPIFGTYVVHPSNTIFNWGVYEWLRAYGLVQPWELPIVYPLWFVRNLFVLNVVAVVIKKAVDYAPKIGLLLVTVLLLVPTGLDGYTTESLIFWIFGYYVVKYNIRDGYLVNRRGVIFLGYLLCLMCDFFARGSIVGYGVHKLTCGVGILAFYVLGVLLLESRYVSVFRYLSAFSISIYFFHEPSLWLFRKICSRILIHTTLMQFIEYVFIPIVIMAWCIVLSLVLRRFCPKIYGIITGNRGW